MSKQRWTIRVGLATLAVAATIAGGSAVARAGGPDPGYEFDWNPNKWLWVCDEQPFGQQPQCHRVPAPTEP